MFFYAGVDLNTQRAINQAKEELFSAAHHVQKSMTEVDVNYPDLISLLRYELNTILRDLLSGFHALNACISGWNRCTDTTGLSEEHVRRWYNRLVCTWQITEGHGENSNGS